jgi:hypothetical protein
MFSVKMKISQIIRNVKMFNQKTVDRQNISGIGHGRTQMHTDNRAERLKEKGER